MSKINISIVVIMIIFFNACGEVNKKEIVVENYGKDVIKCMDDDWIIFTNEIQINIEEIKFISCYKKAFKFEESRLNILLKDGENIEILILVDNDNICNNVMIKINEHIRKVRSKK